MSHRREPVPSVSLFPLFFLSGAAGLAAQMVWVRMFAAGLGHETPSVLAVTTAFLGGLALGAWRLEPWILRQPNPARAYAKLELLIGVFAAASTLLIPLVNTLALKLTGPTPSPLWQWLVVFVLPLVTLLPGTLAMGATLPAMERWLSSARSEARNVGALYAANTFGAVAGTLGAVFVLMPALGFRGSLVVSATVNLLCSGCAWWLSNGDGAPSIARLEGKSFSSKPSNARRSGLSRPLGSALFLTGLLGIAFQLGVVRVLSQVFENTVYSYAAALAVYLAATALGAALYQRFVSRGEFRSASNHLLFALATAAVLSVALLPWAGTIYQTARGWFGESLGGAVAAELLVSVVALALPAALMGAVFSHLVQGVRETTGSIGRAAALNTLGCALAAPLVVMVLPGAGVKWMLVGIAVGYVLLLPNWSSPGWRWIPFLAVFVLGARGDLRLVDRPENSELIAYREGAMASVAVVKTSDGHRSLRVNNRLQMGGTGAALAERRQAHLPLLLHPSPARALFLGPGTGITLGAASLHPELRVDGVELVPEVVESMRHFEPENEGPFPNARVTVTAADARRFVRTTTNRYDVIVADLFHPAQDGAGFLYTYEHFAAVRARLNAGGLFCQWLPLHQLDEASLRSIAGTFLDTFSETRAFLLHFNVDIPALALVGTLEPDEVDARVFERRLETSDLRARLRGVGLERFINLAGCFAADTQTLLEWAGNARPGTDDFPTVLFAAPRFAVRRDAAPHELLLTLLGRWRTGETDLAAAGFGAAGSPFVAELRDYLAARDMYLRGLVEEAAGRLDAATKAYLESARRSLQFTPGYARCVTVIQLVAKTDMPRARALFDRLEAAQPKQPLGRKLLGPLFGLP